MEFIEKGYKINITKLWLHYFEVVWDPQPQNGKTNMYIPKEEIRLNRSCERV